MSQAKMIIANIEQVAAPWLTAALRQSGALSGGSVQAVSTSPAKSDNSSIWQLTLTYSEDAAGERPSALLLKLVANEDFGPSEVEYYTRDYRGVPDAPLVRCYDAAFCPLPSPHYHLLLADHSATHRVQFQVQPTLAYSRALARALAVLHAHWWDRVAGTVADVDRLWQHAYPGLEPMLHHAGDEIPADWPARIRGLCQPVQKAMRQRITNGRPLTLVHVDVNPGNVLAPRQGEGPLYLLDRQPFDWSLMHWTGPSDLAYALVLWWETAVWQRWLPQILETYHAELVNRGVTSYSLADVWLDFRLGAAQCLTIPLGWCVDQEPRETMKWVWLPELQRTMTAVAHLKVGELLV